MPRLLPVAVVLILAVSGCSGSAADGGEDAALADLWASLSGASSVYPDCVDRFETVYEFGSRDLACKAAASFPLEVLVDRAPVTVFQSGPHAASAQRVDLRLTAGRQFGRYNPAFVRWVTEAAVVRGEVAQRLVAPIYRAQVARSARIFWLTHQRLAEAGYPDTVPDGPLADYAAYLGGGPVTEAIRGYLGDDSVSPYAMREAVPLILPPGEPVVEGAESPLGEPLTADHWRVQTEVATALTFWIRRDADGTADEWRTGLRSMLAAYDADWLASHGG